VSYSTVLYYGIVTYGITVLRNVIGPLPVLLPEESRRSYPDIHQLYRLHSPSALRLLSSQEDATSSARQHAPETETEESGTVYSEVWRCLCFSLG